MAWWKTAKIFLLPLLIGLILVACNERDAGSGVDIATLNSALTAPNTASQEPDWVGQRYDSKDTWAIYWYLCGSDLESDYGAATADLNELLEVTLPKNVQVIIETDGAYEWQNEIVSSDGIGRYLYDSNGFFELEQLPAQNMGSPETLRDFLAFCSGNYPADHTMMLFWNHGGGSVTGAAFDELYEFDSLTLDELYSAFQSVYPLSTESPPFEVIGFDTCLMATIDVAYTFSDIGRYLVASEEVAPAVGWYYSRWMQALADDPGMNGGLLGKAICDAYVAGCKQEGLADEITLSVTDLTKLEPLLTAYENIGKEALSASLKDPGFFSTFGREAVRSENYGGNTETEGYTNMVDLGALVRNSRHILPRNAQDVLNALEDCVVYKVNGPYRSEATGLSCYYSYNGDIDHFNAFVDVGASDSFKYLYSYELGGQMSEAGMEYVSEMGYEALPTLQGVDDAVQSLLEIGPTGTATLTVGPKTANLLKGVYFQLFYIEEESDSMLLLGRDNDIVMDWENGIFKENFRGVWGAIDDNLVYMEIVYEGEDYNSYSVPILLNGEVFNLRVIYDYTDEQFYILGARKGLSDSGMADKNLIQLKPGDRITTMHYLSSVTGDDDFEAYEVDTFSVTENTAFREIELGDGEFAMMFELVDMKNRYSLM